MNDDFGLLKNQFNINLNQKDWMLFRTVASKLVIERPTIRLKLFWFNLIIWFGIALVLTLFKKEIIGLHIPTIAVLCLLFVGVLFDIILVWRIQQNGFIPLKKGFWVGLHTFSLFENALVVESTACKCIYSWELIKYVKDDKGNLFIFIDSYFGYVFSAPKIKVENIGELEKHLCRLCERGEAKHK